MAGTDITVHPIRLGLGATAEVEPSLTGSMDWYASYVERHASDSVEGRLVSMYSFSESWDTWEMHPAGSEVVLCISGTITLHQQRADGWCQTVSLSASQFALNEPGTWHTADVEEEATVLFITAGLGTQHRPR